MRKHLDDSQAGNTGTRNRLFLLFLVSLIGIISAVAGSSGPALAYHASISTVGPRGSQLTALGDSRAIQNGLGPTGIAYDSGRQEMFVTDSGSNLTSVINDISNTVVATIAVGSSPESATYDPVVDDVYVTNADSNNVSVISDLTNTVIATVRVGADPVASAYDPMRGEIYVANETGLSVISETTNKVVDSIPLPCACSASSITYDGRQGELFVTMVGATYNGSNTIEVVNDTSNALIDTIQFGPVILMGSAFDSATNQVLVTNEFGENVLVIDPQLPGESWTVQAPGIPIGVVFDPGTDQVFVANQWTNAAGIVGVYSGENYRLVENVTVGAGSRGVAYDSHLGEVFVTCPWADTVSVINDTTDLVVATIPLSSPGTAAGLPVLDYYIIAGVALIVAGMVWFSLSRRRK